MRMPRRRKKKKVYASISFQILTIVYLTFLIAYQLNAPTTAYYSDTVTYRSTLLTMDAFEEEEGADPSENDLNKKISESDKKDQITEESNQDETEKAPDKKNNNKTDKDEENKDNQKDNIDGEGKDPFSEQPGNIEKEESQKEQKESEGDSEMKGEQETDLEAKESMAEEAS